MAFQFWRWKVEKPLQCPDCNLRFDKEEKLVDHQCDKEVLQNAHLAGRSVGAGEALSEFKRELGGRENAPSEFKRERGRRVAAALNGMKR